MPYPAVANGSGSDGPGHNYVTPWPIVLILVCMNREGPYLEGVRFGKSRRGLDVLQKNSLARRGLSVRAYMANIKSNC